MNDPQTPPESSEPWEQQPGEPSRWYARFERFRLAGPSRSLLGAINIERQQNGKRSTRSVPQAWAKAAQQWRWRERADAWDVHERRQARAAHAQQIEEMNRRHVQEARGLQSAGIGRLKSLDLEQMSPSEVLRFLVAAAKLERTALGVPESIEEQRLTGAGGGAVLFTLEDAVRADQELEEWNHDRLQSPGSGPLPEGDPQVP
jgi:hypothetical protein